MYFLIIFLLFYLVNNTYASEPVKQTIQKPTNQPKQIPNVINMAPPNDNLPEKTQSAPSSAPSAPQDAIYNPVSSPSDIHKNKELLHREVLNVPLNELKKAKEKVRQYREVLDGDSESEIPTVISRTVYLSDGVSHMIKMRHNIMTRILLPEKEVKLDKIGIGNKEFFKVEVRQNNVFITPTSKFNFTNLHIMADKGDYHFLLKEIPHTSTVDGYLIVKKLSDKVGLPAIINALYSNVISDNIKSIYSLGKQYKKAVKVLNEGKCYALFNDIYYSDNPNIEYFIINTEDTVIGVDCNENFKITRGKDGKEIVINSISK